MTHVNLDTQPEAVRQFVLWLSTSLNSVVLESAGRPVACMVPSSIAANSAQDDKWTEEDNRRRCQLLDRKNDAGLSAVEEAELALLQEAMYRHIDRVAPLPLDEARRLQQELLEKAARCGDANQT